MIICIILQELYDKISPITRCNNYFNYQTFLLSVYSFPFKITLELFYHKYDTIKKSVRHYHRILSLLINPVVFSGIVRVRAAGADITPFSPVQADRVNFPKVCFPFIENASHRTEAAGVNNSAPNVADTVRTRKDGIITPLHNSPVSFHSAGGE
jgi:hypothetical protein